MSNSSINRIGIFSGSLDPPHKGHIHISKVFLKKLKLNNQIIRWGVNSHNEEVNQYSSIQTFGDDAILSIPFLGGEVTELKILNPGRFECIYPAHEKLWKWKENFLCCTPDSILKDYLFNSIISSF